MNTTIRGAIIVAMALSISVLAGTVFAGGQEKTAVCHNGHTIEIGTPAVPAHLEHGDYVGVCEDNGGGGNPI